MIVDDSEEQFKHKCTHTNFYYPKEFTIEDSGRFISDQPSSTSGNIVYNQEVIYKFKRTAKLVKIVEEDR